MMRRRTLLLFTITASSVLSIGACVGDDPGAGTEATSEDASGADQTASDGNAPTDGASGGETSTPVDSGPDAAPRCGFGGDACCAAPLAACGDGLACVSNVCKANDIWAVGSFIDTHFFDSATAGDYYSVSAHYDGTSWSAGPSMGVNTTGKTYYPTGIWGTVGSIYRATTTGERVYNYLSSGTPSWRVCGTTGFDGLLAETCDDPMSTQALYAIFGFGVDDLWVAGSNTMKHCTGAGCTSVTTGLPGSFGQGELTGSSSSDLWYSQFDRVFHYNGATWTTTTGLQANAIWAASATDVWIGTTAFQHYNGATWSSNYALENADGGPAGRVYAMSGSSTDNIWALGNEADGSTFGALWNGSVWKVYPIPGASQAASIWTVSKSEAYASEDFLNTIYRWDGTSWTAMTMPNPPQPGVTVTWQAIGGSSRPRP